MENPSQLQDVLSRLQRLFPTTVSGVSPPASQCWMDEGVATEALEGAILRSGWTMLKSRYDTRLKAMRDQIQAPFESTRETIILQCRALNEVLDELDKARREAITRSRRRLAVGKA